MWILQLIFSINNPSRAKISPTTSFLKFTILTETFSIPFVVNFNELILNKLATKAKAQRQAF